MVFGLLAALSSSAAASTVDEKELDIRTREVAKTLR